MERVFKTTLLVSTLTAVLLSAWYLTKVGQIGVCINSKTVFKFDIVSGQASNQRKSLPVCSEDSVAVSRLPGFLDIRKLGQINDTFNRFESLQSALDLKAGRIAVVVRADRPFSYRVSSNEVELGIDVISARGQLFRALISALIEQKIDGLGRIEKAILADLIVASSLGVLDIEDPRNSKSTKNSLEYDHIGKLIQSESSICNTVWALPEDFESCDFVFSNDNAQAKVSTQSVRAIVAKDFHVKLSRLSFSEQSGVLRKLFEIAGDGRFKIKFGQATNHVTEFLGSIRKFENHVFGGTFEEGTSRALRSPDLALFIESKDITKLEPVFAELDWNASYSQKLVFIVSSCGLQYYPGGPCFENKFDFRAKKIVRIGQSRALTVAEIERLKSEDGKILSIRTLDKSLELSTYLFSGIREWMARNREVQFDYYYRDAVVLAKSWGLARGDHVALKRNKLNHTLTKLFGFDNPSYIKEAEVYKVAGPLSVIEWSR